MDTSHTENQSPDRPMRNGGDPRISWIKTSGIAISLTLLCSGIIWLGTTYWMPARTPDLSLISLEGKTYTLDAGQDNPVLIVFWSTTCLQCLREIPDLISLYRDLHPAGLEIIGVTMPYDPPSKVVAITNSIGINYPITLDVEGKIGKAFGGITATPTTFLVAPDGLIVMQHTGITDMNTLRQKVMNIIQKKKGIAFNNRHTVEASSS